MRQAVWAMFLAVTALSSPAFAGPIFFQDFNSGLEANEIATGEFGITTTGLDIDGTPNMGHSRTYSNNQSYFYQVSGVDLTNVSDAMLTFDFNMDTESGFDFVRVFVDGAYALPAAGSGLSSATSGSRSGVARFDLSSSAGSAVTLRIAFTSDATIRDIGFNMDNFSVTGTPAVPEPTSLALLGLGGIGLVGGAIRKRRQRKLAA